MKNLACLFVLILLASCTSNTIFEKPKDLIPKDTMSLLLQEMVIAINAKFTKNKKEGSNISYMPFVYEKFKIDSARFEASNYYYMSKIDIYQEILEGAKTNLERRNTIFKKIQKELDSIKKEATDSILREKLKQDSLHKLDTLNLDIEKVLPKIDLQKI